MKIRMEMLKKEFSLLKAIPFDEINKDSEHCMALSLGSSKHIVSKLYNALQNINNEQMDKRL